MSMQAMIRKLLPHEDGFYVLLERQSALLVDAARAFAGFADGVPAQAVLVAVGELEARADRVVVELDQLLARIFVTPIDREDIQALATTIDDITDTIHVTARGLVVYAVEEPTRPMVELIRRIVVMAELLAAELPALGRHEYAKLIVLGRQIHRHEKECGRLFREAVGALLDTPDLDPVRLLRDKEILDNLERAIDRFEAVGERLRNLAVKHG